MVMKVVPRGFARVSSRRRRAPSPTLIHLTRGCQLRARTTSARSLALKSRFAMGKFPTWTHYVRNPRAPTAATQGTRLGVEHSGSAGC